MAAENTVVPLAAARLRYRFVSISQIVGFSDLREAKDLELPLGLDNARAFLTLDPSSSVASIDRCTGLAYLAFNGFEGKTTAPEILADLERQRQRIVAERAKSFPAAVFLIVETHGIITSKATDVSRDLGDAVFAFDAVDKSALIAAHQPQVNAIVCSLLLVINTSTDIVRVLEGIAFTLPDNRPLYTISITMGEARLTHAVAATADHAARFAQIFHSMRANVQLQTPSRLWADASRASTDRLEAFILAWAGLEAILGKYTAGAESGQWLQQVSDARRAEAEKVHGDWRKEGHRGYSLGERIQVFALLTGLDGHEDLAQEIVGLKNRFREPLFHRGEIQEAKLPVDRVRAIVKSLLEHVLIEH
jgi:phospholipid N-methyltransferase